MTLKEYIDRGGRYYQRTHMGNFLWRFILKGLDHSGNPADWAKEEAQDIKEGKALVLCPKGVFISNDLSGTPTVNWGVKVFYPKFNWEDEPELKTFKEMSLEDILKYEDNN